MEIVMVEPKELRPFDMLGEGRVILAIHYNDRRWTPDGIVRWDWLEVADATVVVRDLGDGMTCRDIEWSDGHEEALPTEPVRVIRKWFGEPTYTLRTLV